MEETTEIPKEEQKSKEQEYLDQLQRLAADFANYRSRVDKEKLLITDTTKDNLLRKFLEVKDNFERIPKADKGVEMIYTQLNKIFDQEGVQEIIDMNYNPEMHEAIATAEGQENTIIEVTRKGYRRNGKVLRPSQVILGKKMKSIEQVREEFICPKSHKKENYAFKNENIFCEECNAHYDLGHKKYP